MAKRKSTNGDGLFVDTIYYRYKGIKADDGTLRGHDVREDEGIDAAETQSGIVEEVVVAVEVRLKKKYEAEAEGENRPVRALSFSLVCANPKIEVTGPDIEVLRAAMWGHLDKAFQVKWETYYLVQIRPGITYGDGISHGLSFSYDTVYKGTAHDGSLMMKRYQGYSRGYLIEPWPGRFKDTGGNLLACIEGTEENRAALQNFGKRVDELRERLAKFFRPETIMQTLSNLSSVNMLGISPDES